MLSTVELTRRRMVSRVPSSIRCRRTSSTSCRISHRPRPPVWRTGGGSAGRRGRRGVGPPSRTDISLASEPGAHYVLVSTREPDSVEMRSYRIVEGEVAEEEITVN